jgi:YtkA-like
MSLASDSGELHFDVRTSPTQPPTRGQQSVQLVITDSSGAPAKGLVLDTTPWMPAMGHGASVTPSVSETTPGTYVIEDVDMFMPGTWELRTTIASAGSNTADHVAPSFQIP